MSEPNNGIVPPKHDPSQDPRIRRALQKLLTARFLPELGPNLEINAAGELQVAIMDRPDDADGLAEFNALLDSHQDVSLMDTWDITTDGGDSIYWNDGAGTTGQLVA